MEVDRTTNEPKSEVGNDQFKARIKKGLWQKFADRIRTTAEGKILVLGILLTVAYLTVLGLTRLRGDDLFVKLVLLTGTHLVWGRLASITFGTLHEMSPTITILASTTVETIMTLLFFPLFVFSYQKLIVIKPLQDAMERAQHAAERHQVTIMKYGIPGLLIFVWFPLWMTGPVVGCVIGFLIGLRPWTNMGVVLVGTWTAIYCWGVVLKNVADKLQELGPFVPFLVVGAILLIAISIHIRYAASKSNNNRSE